MLWFFHPDSESEISLGIISPSTAAGEADDSSEQAKVTRVSRHRLLALARSQQDTQGSDTFHPSLGHANASFQLMPLPKEPSCCLSEGLCSPLCLRDEGDACCTAVRFEASSKRKKTKTLARPHGRGLTASSKDGRGTELGPLCLNSPGAVI